MRPARQTERSPRRLAALAGACAVLAVAAAGAVRQAPPATPHAEPRWADWVEPDFPFFSSVIDARKAGPGFPADNLTPRGLVLNLGQGLWLAFDTDLLRVAAVWRGSGLTPRALAPLSYNHPDRKTPLGQSLLPEPDGTVWLANGIYPGWQSGAVPALTDPREPAPSPEEVGRGPLPDARGRFDAVRLAGGGAVLEYTVSNTPVREYVVGAGSSRVERHFEVAPSTEPLWLILGQAGPKARLSLCAGSAIPLTVEPLPAALADGRESGAHSSGVKIPPRGEPLRFCAAMSEATADAPLSLREIPSAKPPSRWPQEVTTALVRSTSTGAYVVDDVELPFENPWRRNVRLGDIQFQKDGTGFGVTLDGDVWMVRGLHGPDGRVTWRRFASGLHEPLTLAVRDDEIFVFDRNGIWRLRDTDGNGEADAHELFSNAFAQTADTREFPSTIRLAPGGEFVIAKGGQESATFGKHNGSVLRISADGRRARVLGYGFRQPNIGVHPRTGLVTSSDQQGHYIPTTPLHIVEGGQFYGFLSDKAPREQYPGPIAEPLTWIPHAANASAMSQVWLTGARMGPLNGSMIHIGFNNPEIFRVLLNERAPRLQAAVVSVTRAFEFPTLNGSVNPADGQLYLAGFQVLGWGTTATRLAGLGRVRYTGAPSTLPRELVPMESGVLLRFDAPLDRVRAADPDNYSLTSWQYKRTYQYGSAQFKSDGTPGIDRLPPSRAYVSKDGTAVFVAVPGMTAVMQMRLGWSLATADGAPFQESAYFTPYELVPFNPVVEGFEELTVDLSPRAVAADDQAGPVSVEEGKRLAQLYGCVACHSIETAAVSRLGPTWKGLFGSERPYAKGVLRAIADEAYLKESILEPTAKVVSGYERGESGMPSYRGVLNERQIDAILLFIKSLK